MRYIAAIVLLAGLACGCARDKGYSVRTHQDTWSLSASDSFGEGFGQSNSAYTDAR